MRSFALAASLCFALATAQQPWPAHAAMDGFVSREEALRIVETPLDRTIGRAEAERVQRVAVANAMLEYCGLDWGPLFRLLTSHHRHRQGRSETEMSRVTVWHGVWQGQAQAAFRRDRPVCDEETRRAALGNAARQVQTFTPSSGGS